MAWAGENRFYVTAQALIAPDIAINLGTQTNNAAIYSWGADQKGYLTSPPIITNEYRKTSFQGRTVYQRSDIDWDYFDTETGLTNQDRARRGLAPIGLDGEKVNLHHLLQQEPGPMVEVPATVHQNGQKILHGLIEPGQSFRNDPVLNRQYNQFRIDYWKWRATWQ